jgi:hypothetical protein
MHLKRTNSLNPDIKGALMFFESSVNKLAEKGKNL